MKKFDTKIGEIRQQVLEDRERVGAIVTELKMMLRQDELSSREVGLS